VRVQLLHLPGDLGAYVHVVSRLEYAGRGDGIFEISALRHRDRVTRGIVGPAPRGPSEIAAGAEREQRRQRDAGLRAAAARHQAHTLCGAILALRGEIYFFDPVHGHCLRSGGFLRNPVCSRKADRMWRN
jgi:hypothetical protein